MGKWHRWGLRDTPFFQDELTYGPGAEHPVERLLVGRREEARLALATFDGEHDARCIVEGDPGVGKTSFVNHVKAQLVKGGARAEVEPIQIESTTTGRQLEAEALRVILRVRQEERNKVSGTQALAQTARRAVDKKARDAAAFWDDADARVNSRTTTGHGVSGGLGPASIGFQRQRERQQADQGTGTLRTVFEEAVARFYAEYEAPILLHVDNVEFLSDQEPGRAAVLIRDLRSFYTTPHTYWIFVGTSGLERTVFRKYAQVSGFFADVIRLDHLDPTEVAEALRERYAFLQKGVTPYTAPVEPGAAAALYHRYQGDLRNFLRLLESACLRSVDPRTLTEADVLTLMAPKYLDALRHQVGPTVLGHLKRTVCGPRGGDRMTEFRQTDMQRRAGIKGPATKNALEVLLAHKYIVFSHQTGTSKFYRITGETSIALGLPLDAPSGRRH